ncbi:hypothetical protein RclHR1_13670005 [Rhizophagus clarus]|uniref:BAH domain-containing protein n=1 Tax=Rhizophagus clarus TaxID=94130 RepID=A0A2Z6QQI3_9GLOM|nr:hypothetical protein RclHR1_13670005 [Rhizophagus clarus]
MEVYTHENDVSDDTYVEMEPDNDERYGAFNERMGVVSREESSEMMNKVSDNETSSEEFDDDEISSESFDDDETTSEEFDVNETSSEEFNDEEASSGDVSEDKPDEIVDEPLCNEKMPPINGEFAPYFNNITEALMFCWIQKHNIYHEVYTHENDVSDDTYVEMEPDNDERYGAFNERMGVVSREESSEMMNEVFDNETSSEEFDDDEISSESFDDDETTSEEFDVNETSSEEFNDEEASSGDVSEDEPDEIVDEPLCNEKMPPINGEFAPYFNNITEALMFCWIQKHNISTHAYDELVDIIHHPQFKNADVVTNIRQFRKYRQRLPLLPIRSRSIHISDKKTSSTSQRIKDMYYLSITDIIWYTLNNPSLFSQMYFGPDQQVERNQKLWHGDLWKESPRFGQASIKINGVIYNSGDFIVYRESATRIGRILAIVRSSGILKIKIQRTLVFNKLPNNLQSNNRRERTHGREVWLLDQNVENATIITDLQTIVRHITITILYENNTNEYSSIIIRKILYKYHGRWKLRNVAYSYQHPSEFAALKDPETNLPVYKLYIDLYYDDLGTFCNVYHTLGGVYIQIGNLPFNKRKQLKNYFVLGFVPFGGKFNEFIEPFIVEMKQLEEGKIMDIQGNQSFVIASLGDVTADLPQGNDLAGVKRHAAAKGCRTCNMTKDSWTSDNVDMLLVSRYHHLTDSQFGEISATQNIVRREEIAAGYGLCIQPSILDELKREKHLQSPHDVYHATAGKVLRFLKITIDALSLEGKSSFIIFWRSFDYPRIWQKLPNPISHINSFMMSDCLRLGMMIPFIFNRFLKPQHFKRSELTSF